MKKQFQMRINAVTRFSQLTCLVFVLATVGCVPLQPANAPRGEVIDASAAVALPFTVDVEGSIPSENRAAVHILDGKTIVDVISPSGFGSAEFTLNQAAPSEQTRDLSTSQQLVIRLRVKHLEQLRVSTSTSVVSAVLSGAEDGAERSVADSMTVLVNEPSYQEMALLVSKPSTAAGEATNEKMFGEYAQIDSGSDYWLVFKRHIQTSTAEASSSSSANSTSLLDGTVYIDVEIPSGVLQDLMANEGNLSIEWIDFYR